ncbi:glycosyltransferase family 2 protein [Chloroflexota bacterium]
METHGQRDYQSLPTHIGIPLKDIKVSICIVTYKAKDLLRDCLNSISTNSNLEYEVIVIDNGSRDGVAEMLVQEFPQVHFIENEFNLGFTQPMNHALRLGRGQYLLQLNPDTITLPNAIDSLAVFMDKHIEVGICGPKVLNRDHTMQKPCRRGESRPLAVISYFTGLAALFPKSKLFGEYLMSYMDEEETHQVAGVSGSCMMIRRKVLDQIGFLDEQFFAFQEDADFCFRTKQAGWEIFYVPKAQIIHFGSMGGSRVHPYRSIFEWHKSYYLFYRKNMAKDYFFLFNWIFYFAMILKFLSSILINIFRVDKQSGLRKP